MSKFEQLCEQIAWFLECSHLTPMVGRTVVSSDQLEIIESVTTTDIALPQVMLALVSVPCVDVIHLLQGRSGH